MTHKKLLVELKRRKEALEAEFEAINTLISAYTDDVSVKKIHIEASLHGNMIHGTIQVNVIGFNIKIPNDLSVRFDFNALRKIKDSRLFPEVKTLYGGSLSTVYSFIGKSSSGGTFDTPVNSTHTYVKNTNGTTAFHINIPETQGHVIHLGSHPRSDMAYRMNIECNFSLMVGF